MIARGCFTFLLLLLSRDGASLALLKAPSDSLRVTHSLTLVTRRDAWVSSFAVVTGTAATAIVIEPGIAATENALIGIFVKGTVNLPSDIENSLLAVRQPDNGAADTTTRTTPELYITCRPDRPDNVPQAILAGTRGKPPPVLAARFVNPSFPFSFALGEQDLTMEGCVKDETTGLYWWLLAKKDENNINNKNLVVSARWDSDGIAATRSPEDLVGRAMATKELQQQQQQIGDESSPFLYTATIDLGGRGAFGKFATGGVKK